MLGMNSYRLPIDEGRLMRAKGIQRREMGRGIMGTNTYGGGVHFARRLIARGREGMAFGMGDTEGSKPWYEALFSHIETMSISMAPYVMQILDMSFDQQRAGWAQTSADKREAAYQAMIKDLVGTKAGQPSQFSDPQTRAFLLQQFQRDSAGTQQSVLNNRTGGDANMTASLYSIVTPWYKQYSVTVPIIAVGIAGVLGIVYLTR